MEFRAEAVADFRSKFGMPFWGTDPREFVLLMKILLRDPTSWLYAAAAGWEYPASREHLAIVDLVDIQHASKSKKKITPYPRPWVKVPKRIGTGSRTVDELRAVLRRGDDHV